jgi:hypothetical protein
MRDPKFWIRMSGQGPLTSYAEACGTVMFPPDRCISRLAVFLGPENGWPQDRRTCADNSAI